MKTPLPSLTFRPGLASPPAARASKKLSCLLALALAACAPLPASAQYFAPLSVNTTSGQVVLSNGQPPANLTFSNITVSGAINGNYSGGGGGGSGNLSATGNFATVFAQSANTTLTLPGANGALATTATAQTFNNKTISGANNTISNVTYSGDQSFPGNISVGGNISGTWNGTAFPISQVTNLASDLAALAPQASPVLTGSPTVTGNLAVSGNSSALNFNGTNAFFTNLTISNNLTVPSLTTTNFTVTNLQVNGNLAFGSVNSTIIPGNAASLANNGTFLTAGPGNSLIENNGNSTQQNTTGTSNTLTLWDTNEYGNSAMNFRDYLGNETGAIGYGNYPFNTDALGSRIFLAASMPLDDRAGVGSPWGLCPPGNVTTPTGLIFVQQAYYNGGSTGITRTCMLFDEHWQFSMGLPGGGNWLDAQTPGQNDSDSYDGASPDIQLNLSGNTSGNSYYVGYNAFLGPQRSGPELTLIETNSTLHGDYYAFPANGTVLMGQNGSGGLSFITTNSSTGADFAWYAGGLGSGNQKMILTNAGNLAIGTMTPATGALLTVAGDAAMSGNITLSGNVTDASSAGYPQGVMVTSSNASGIPFFAAHDSAGTAFDMELPTYNGTAQSEFISNTTTQWFISDADGSSINFAVGATYQNDTLQVNGANIAVTGNASVSGNLTTASGPPFAITGNNTTTLFLTINGIARNITFAP